MDWLLYGGNPGAAITSESQGPPVTPAWTLQASEGQWALGFGNQHAETPFLRLTETLTLGDCSSGLHINSVRT